MADSMLNLYTRKEGVIKGAYLEKPEKHDILLAIEERTTIKNAKNDLLMRYGDIVAQLTPRYSEVSLNKSIIELKLDHLIAIIPGISVDESCQILRAEMFFVSRPEKKNYDIPDIYREVVDKTVTAIISYAKNNNLFNRDLFWKDLETSLSESGNMEIFYPQIYFSMDSIFEASENYFKAENKLLDQFKYDIMKQLVYLRHAVWVLDQKVFLIPVNNLQEIAATLSAFFYNRIMPQYESISSIAREFDFIRYEEEIYNIENGLKKTMKFTAKKTFAIQKYLEEEKYKNEKTCPGKLVFTMIRELEKHINELHEKNYVSQVYLKYEELKNRISGRGEVSPQPIFFLDEKELSQYPPESIEKVKQDKQIIHTSWETKAGTVEVFMQMAHEKFNSGIDSFLNLPHSDFWKILAYRKLLQDSSKILPEINPFNNEKFLKKYGVLLNQAYLNILPFYFNLLLLIQVGFIKNLVYRSIKSHVNDTQKQLGKTNENRREAKKKIFKNLLAEKKSFLKRIMLRNRILDELDFFYFKQNAIPSILDVKERFPDVREADFMDIVREFQFTMIPAEASDQGAQNILYYPKSTTWSYNLEKTRDQVQRMLKAGNGVSGKNGSDQILTKRIHALNINLQLLS